MTPTGTPPPTPTASPTATWPATPTSTPSPAPPTAYEIYQRLAPSVAYIVTATGTGSGILLADGYVVTNAHVVWPFDRARLVFADGAAFDDVPVVATDFLVDLAILGPVDTGLPPVELASAEELRIGDPVYLVGYPAEGEQLPQPAITQGIISRMRRWESQGITYFQSDAAVAGGQSGGMFVSPAGEVIGVSGFSLADNFAVVASAADLRGRIARLLAGDESLGVPVRDVLLRGEERNFATRPQNFWDQHMFVFYNPSGPVDVEVEVEGDDDVYLSVADAQGEYPVYSEEPGSTQAGDFSSDGMAPYFVIVGPDGGSPSTISVASNRRLAPYTDLDDGVTVTVGSTFTWAVDFPGDVDHFTVELKRREPVTITVDSVMIDAYLQLDGSPETAQVTESDDDSGGGLFGTNSAIVYEPLRDGEFVITVEDVGGVDVGGYVLRIERERSSP
jgi:hypothetical protein